MRIVIALGGNALLHRGEPLEASIQKENIAIAAIQIASVIKAGHQVVICHGNGPQVGLLALQSNAYKEVKTYPFDVLNAESQSMIGYMLQQAVQNQLRNHNVATIVTQVEVDMNDPAFENPQKFIGPVYTDEEANQIRTKNHWTLKKDNNKYRRVIASPLPKKIIEIDIIEALLEKNMTPICCGGGGIPVIKQDQLLVGIEAVIDKDRTAALLAEKIAAEKLIILTDVDGVYNHYGTDKQELIHKITVNELNNMKFAAGSMGPKVAAACQFVSQTGHNATIGALSDLSGILNNSKGTQIWQ